MTKIGPFTRKHLCDSCKLFDSARNDLQRKTLITQFLLYSTGDALTYLLGFASFTLLVRAIPASDFGRVATATGIQQVLMMMVAVGFDFTGPRLLAKSDQPGALSVVLRQLQTIRIRAALLVGLPCILLASVYFSYRNEQEMVPLLASSFFMVLARAYDQSFAAVALGLPKALAVSRVTGLAIYIVLLLVAWEALPDNIWLIPILNAIGVIAGRILLQRWISRLTPPSLVAPMPLNTKEVVAAGIQATGGQLVMLAFQTLDVLFLLNWANYDTVGQYAMVSRLYLFGTAVLTSIFHVFLPLLLGAHYGEPFRQAFRKYLLTSSLAGVLGAAGFVLLAVPLIEGLSSRHQVVSRQVIPIFSTVFLAIAVATPFYSVLAAMNRERAYLSAMCSGAFALLIFDLILVPRMGAVGAAYGQLAAICFVLMSAAVSYQSLPQRVQTRIKKSE